MYLHRVRNAFLIGVVVAAAAAPAQAQHGFFSARSCNDACATNACAPAAPTFRTVTVTECVPETYKVKRIVNKQVQVEEVYTACRYESVQETRTCTVNVRKCVTKDVTRCVTKCIPVCEERTVMKAHYRNETYTEMVCKKVDRGHYECREVACPLKGLFERFHGNGCCDTGCGDGCGQKQECCRPAPTRTKKVWVSCWVTEQCPVTKCKKVCEMRPEVCKVTTYKRVTENVVCKENVVICVPETRTHTVCVQKPVHYQAKRMVCKCVPTEEEVTCTRMVARQVTRQVAVNPCNDCAPARHGLFDRFKNRGHGCGSSCGGCSN